MNVQVERLTFTFPSDWHVMKFDDTAFYRKQFSRMWQPIKSVDLIAVSDANIAYFIEVKDYRIASDAGPSELPLVVAQKVFDTLAAQLPCKLNANEEAERSISTKICECKQLVVVLHLEQPRRTQGIFRPYNPANVQQKVRQLLKPIHAHPWVVSTGNMVSAPWSVSC